MPPKKWNDNRKKVARFLEQYFDKHERAPSLDEIAKGTGLWKRSVEIVLKGLEKIGYLELTPGISRGIRLIEPNLMRVPLLGDVQAGAPPLSQEEPPEYIKLEKNLVPFRDPVAMRVQGFSMKDAGILPGDVILLRNQRTAENGETIVAYFNGGVTVKSFMKKDDSVELVPANPGFKKMEVTEEDEFHVIGKVMLVLRDLGGCFEMSVETDQ